MKILWICNVVLNDFAEEYQIRKKPFGGWMEGMLHELEKREEIIVGLCFPIIDKERMKSGVHGGHPYYSFHGNINAASYNSQMAEEFKDILKDFKPDVIHIWGTEYNHQMAVVDACEEMGLIDRVLIRLQGIVSLFPLYYVKGIPDKYLDIKSKGLMSINEEVERYQCVGLNEIKIIQNVKYIFDKSEFGKFYSKFNNPNVHFYYVDNIMKDSFYNNAGIWEIKKCEKNRLFVAQASYPIKGIHFLLKAVAVVRHHFPDISVYVAGLNILIPNDQGIISAYGQYLNDLINELNLQDAVHFIGLLDEKEMIRQYQKAHISIVSSIIDNKANAIGEAMMIGTPTIASFVGGNIDAIQHGVDGFLYPADEFYMLAGYIEKILVDDQLAECLSNSAVKTSLKRHNKLMVANQMIDIYQQIVDDSARRGS